MLTQGDSKRLETIRFPLILLILYIHSFIAPVNFASGQVRLDVSPALMALSTTWSDGVARIAVPLFFLMSGYLFFIGFDGSRTSYGAKIRSRARTLLIPYLFWNTLVTALFVLGQSLPQTSPYFNSGPRLADGGVLGIGDSILGVTHHPAAYPFWFIRDLMVLSLLTPLFHAVLARTSWVLPALLFGAWLLVLPFLPIPSLEATTYFVIGAALAMRGTSLFAAERWLVVLGPLYLVLLTTDVVARLGYGIWWFHPPAIALGLLAVLCLPQYALRSPRLTAVLVALSSASFFVFAAHEPMMSLMRKLLYKVLPPTQGVVLGIYLLLPLAIAAITLGAYAILVRVLPRFTALVAGGRAPRTA